jgi:hypothetical protein
MTIADEAQHWLDHHNQPAPPPPPPQLWPREWPDHPPTRLPIVRPWKPVNDNAGAWFLIMVVSFWAAMGAIGYTIAWLCGR